MKQERLRLVKKWCDPEAHASCYVSWQSPKWPKRLLVTGNIHRPAMPYMPCQTSFKRVPQFRSRWVCHAVLRLHHHLERSSLELWCGTWYPLCICLSFCDFCLLNVEPIGLVSSSVSQNHRIIVYQCVSIFHHEETNFIRSQTARGCASMRSRTLTEFWDWTKVEQRSTRHMKIAFVAFVRFAQRLYSLVWQQQRSRHSAELGRIQKNNAEI